jgi:hypothetical protein
MRWWRVERAERWWWRIERVRRWWVEGVGRWWVEGVWKVEVGLNWGHLGSLVYKLQLTMFLKSCLFGICCGLSVLLTWSVDLFIRKKLCWYFLAKFLKGFVCSRKHFLDFLSLFYLYCLFLFCRLELILLCNACWSVFFIIIWNLVWSLLYVT